MKLLQICAVILLYVAPDLHQKRPPDPIKWKQEIKPQQRALYFAVPLFFNGKSYNSRRTTGHFVPIMRVYSE